MSAADWRFYSSSATTASLRAVWQQGARASLLVSCSRGFCTQPSSSVGFPLAVAMTEDSHQIKELVLDRGNFKERLHLQALRIPKQHSHFVSKTLSRFTLERPKLKHVIHDPDSSENRLVLLAEHISEADVLEEQLAEIRKSFSVEIIPYQIDLDYRYYSVEQVLKGILPEGFKVPASFETVGHIAHINLTDELLPYRKIIAEVFLDKNQPKIKTIVNKVGTITNEFRVPTWEVLAGDANLVTEVRQHNATFRLDFGLVYWNSRLESEHRRLSSQFRPGQVILDMFAGIGPFAIPAAQKGCVVFANDLNPASVQYLEVNAKINKVAGNINIFNQDAREFMKNLQRRGDFGLATQERVDDHSQWAKDSTILTGVRFKTPAPPKSTTGAIDHEENREQDNGEGKERTEKGHGSNVSVKSEAKPWEEFHHVVMNLPASALEFLDLFQGLLSRKTWKSSMPRVHCYCFMRASEATTDVVKRAESFLGGQIKDPEIWTVRDVAPNKIMLCVSFDLPDHIAFGELQLQESTQREEKDDQVLEEEHTSAQMAYLQNKRLRTEN